VFFWMASWQQLSVAIADYDGLRCLLIATMLLASAVADCLCCRLLVQTKDSDYFLFSTIAAVPNASLIP
jgi:hypothetical protein